MTGSLSSGACSMWLLAYVVRRWSVARGKFVWQVHWIPEVFSCDACFHSPSSHI